MALLERVSNVEQEISRVVVEPDNWHTIATVRHLIVLPSFTAIYQAPISESLQHLVDTLMAVHPVLHRV